MVVVKSATTAVMAAGGSAGFNFSHAARSRDTNPSSPFVARARQMVRADVSSL